MCGSCSGTGSSASGGSFSPMGSGWAWGAGRHGRCLWQPPAALCFGAGVVAGPWLIRMPNDLAGERRERIRTQERAEIAARVHDSVLHTLALIQRNIDDPREVARLARAQERDLRSWLYRPGTPAPSDR